MRIRWKKNLLILLVLSSFFVTIGLNTILYQLRPYSLYDPWVNFGLDPTTEVIISWESSEKEAGSISYGINPNNLANTYIENSATILHHCYLTNLTSDTTYYYKIGEKPIQSSAGSQIYQFHTALPSLQGNLSFLAVSDTQQMMGGGFHKKIADSMSNFIENKNFVIHAGDLVGDRHRMKDWHHFFKTGNPYLGSAVFIPAIGNHDGNLNRQNPPLYPKTFRSYFPISNDSSQVFYSFNYSFTHFLVLDFQYAMDFEFTAAQMDFIHEDLDNAQDFPFKIVVFHAPVFSSGFYGKNWQLQSKIHPLMQDYNVSLVLNGHDHHYERIERDGVNYVILGSGGAVQDLHEVITPGSQKIVLGPSFSDITINSTTLILHTYNLQHEIMDHWILHLGGDS